MIIKSVEGSVNQNIEMLNEVIFNFEPKANEFEIKLDDKLIEIIAKYSPKARALRTVSMLMKMNNDLERMADHGVNISRCGIDISNYSPSNDFDIIQQMSEQVSDMLRDAVSAFINNDVDLANKILENDDNVNQLKENLREKMINKMTINPQNIPRSMFILDISRNLERIADLTTNIAENVIFIVNGVSIKHNF
jgi:phosphate transport system protein